MEPFEIIDEETSATGFSQKIKSSASTIGLFAKVIAIVTILIQIIGLIFTFYFSGFGAIMGTLISAAVTIGLSIALLKFAQSMTVFSKETSAKNFDIAMYQQRMYWQFLGILMMIGLFFGIIAFIVAGNDFFNARNF